MPDSAKRSADLIIGRGLLTAEALAAELRSRLADELTNGWGAQFTGEMLARARRTLSDFEPLLAETLLDADLASWLVGFDHVANRVPAALIPALAERGGTIPPRFTVPGVGEGGRPQFTLPLIDEAAKRIAKSRILSREQFDDLAAEAKRRAFTVAGIDSDSTLEKIRDTLSENVAQGTSLRRFEREIRQSISTSAIGSGHLENVYRTNVQQAFHDGHDALANDPVVSDVFPYQEYLAIHDGRVRPDHLALESLGLDGTGVYRRDDPFWNVFTPPWDYQCRCGVNLLTVEAAARKGVREAQEWLRTGQPPARPEHRLSAIPFRPDPRFSQRGRLAAA